MKMSFNDAKQRLKASLRAPRCYTTRLTPHCAEANNTTALQNLPPLQRDLLRRGHLTYSTINKNRHPREETAWAPEEDKIRGRVNGHKPAVNWFGKPERNDVSILKTPTHNAHAEANELWGSDRRTATLKKSQHEYKTHSKFFSRVFEHPSFGRGEGGK